MKTFLSLLVFTLTTLLASAGGDYAVNAPSVPLDVIVKGRKAVMHYLLTQVDRAEVKAVGDSVANPEWQRTQWLDRSTLRSLGYLHAGSFDELSTAISGRPFDLQVVAVSKSGAPQYDLRMEINLYDISGKLLIRGEGYPSIQSDSLGNLYTQMTLLYVWMNQNIKFTASDRASAARWVGEQWGQSSDLSATWNNSGMEFSMPSDLLGGGSLLVARDASAGESSSLIAYDLSTGTSISGRALQVIVERMYTGEVAVLKNGTTIGEHTTNQGFNVFRADNGLLYGRYPLIEMNVARSFRERSKFELPVWGSTLKIRPTKVIITIIYGPQFVPADIGREIEIPTATWQNNDGGTETGFDLNLPQGIYHIRIEYPVEDVSQFPGGIG